MSSLKLIVHIFLLLLIIALQKCTSTPVLKVSSTIYILLEYVFPKLLSARP
jgi:hypothetical protein